MAQLLTADQQTSSVSDGTANSGQSQTSPQRHHTPALRSPSESGTIHVSTGTSGCNYRTHNVAPTFSLPLASSLHWSTLSRTARSTHTEHNSVTQHRARLQSSDVCVTSTFKPPSAVANGSLNVKVTQTSGDHMDQQQFPIHSISETVVSHHTAPDTTLFSSAVSSAVTLSHNVPAPNSSLQALSSNISTEGNSSVEIKGLGQSGTNASSHIMAPTQNTRPSTSSEDTIKTNQTYGILPSTSAEPIQPAIPVQTSFTTSEDALWKVVRAANILKSAVEQWNHYQHSNAALRRFVNRCSDTVIFLQKASLCATRLGTTVKVIGGLVTVAGLVSQNPLLRGVGSRMWKSGCAAKFAGLAASLLIHIWNNGFQTTLLAHLSCLSGLLQNMTLIRSVLEELQVLESSSFQPGRFMPLLLLVCPEDLFSYACHIVRLLISHEHYSAFNDFVTMALSTFPQTALLPVQALHQIESYRIFDCLSDLPQPLQFAAVAAHVGKEIFDLFSSLSTVSGEDFLVIRNLLHKLRAASSGLMQSVGRIPLLNISQSTAGVSRSVGQIPRALTPVPSSSHSQSELHLREDSGNEGEDRASGPFRIRSVSGGLNVRHEVENPLRNVLMRVVMDRSLSRHNLSQTGVLLNLPQTVEPLVQLSGAGSIAYQSATQPVSETNESTKHLSLRATTTAFNMNVPQTVEPDSVTSQRADNGECTLLRAGGFCSSPPWSVAPDTEPSEMAETGQCAGGSCFSSLQTVEPIVVPSEMAEIGECIVLRPDKICSRLTDS